MIAKINFGRDVANRKYRFRRSFWGGGGSTLFDSTVVRKM